MVLFSVVTLLLTQSAVANVLRTVRAFRVIRVFRRLRTLNLLMLAFYQAAAPVLTSIFVLALVLAMFAILAVDLFSRTDPDLFGDFVAALFTMFQAPARPAPARPRRAIRRPATANGPSESGAAYAWLKLECALRRAGSPGSWPGRTAREGSTRVHSGPGSLGLAGAPRLSLRPKRADPILGEGVGGVKPLARAEPPSQGPGYRRVAPSPLAPHHPADHAASARGGGGGAGGGGASGGLSARPAARQVATLDSWGALARSTAAAPGAPGGAAVYGFFVALAVVGGLVLMNVVFAVLLDEFGRAYEVRAARPGPAGG